MQFKKGILCAAGLALGSVMALSLTGCSDGKILSDKALAAVMTRTLGETVEITEAPEGESNGEYRMKCADGTEFTVKRMRLQYNYFGSSYYDYDCDYLVNWVHDHPELTTVLDEKGLSHEDFARGTNVIVRDFEEVHTAVEAACTLVEDSANYIPAVSDFSGDYELRFERPVINVECLTGENDNTDYLWTEFAYQDGTEPVDYDEELEVFLAEQQYVDDVRHGDIDVSLPDELLIKYAPRSLNTQLLDTQKSLSRAKNEDENFPVGKTETVYYVIDSSNTYENERLDFSLIASWAACTGFSPYVADKENYTLIRGEEKVAFRFYDSDCYVERNGVRVALRGNIERSSSSCIIELTTEDLTKLFDTEFQFDYVNGTAEIINQKP